MTNIDIRDTGDNGVAGATGAAGTNATSGTTQRPGDGGAGGHGTAGESVSLLFDGTIPDVAAGQYQTIYIDARGGMGGNGGAGGQWGQGSSFSSGGQNGTTLNVYYSPGGFGGFAGNGADGGDALTQFLGVNLTRTVSTNLNITAYAYGGYGGSGGRGGQSGSGHSRDTYYDGEGQLVRHDHGSAGASGRDGGLGGRGGNAVSRLNDMTAQFGDDADTVQLVIGAHAGFGMNGGAGGSSGSGFPGADGADGGRAGDSGDARAEFNGNSFDMGSGAGGNGFYLSLNSSSNAPGAGGTASADGATISNYWSHPTDGTGSTVTPNSDGAPGLAGDGGDAVTVMNGNTVTGGAGQDMVSLQLAAYRAGGGPGGALGDGSGAVGPTGANGESRIEMTNNLVDLGAGNDRLDLYIYQTTSGTGIGSSDGISLLTGNSFLGGAGIDYFYIRGTVGVTHDFSGSTIAGFEHVTGQDGNQILVLDDGATSVNGGDGDDTIDAGGGDDVLNGDAGDDVLRGGAGNDRFIGSTGNDAMDGGDGIDTVDYGSAQSGVNARLNGGGAPNDGMGGVDTLINIENLMGSGHNDLLIGSNDANVLTGGGGADVLIGLAGDDILDGGTGAANTMQGGLGNDLYIVNAVGDSITEFAGEGTDTVHTRLTSLILATNVEHLTYLGGDFGHSAFTGTGNAGNNIITGGTSADTLSGMGGDDLLLGGNGNDTLNGGDGDDVLVGAAGVDVLNGGAGNDTVDYSGSTSGVDVRLNAGATRNDGVFGQTDTLIAIENVIGSAFNDTLIGDGGVNVLRGGAGGDVLLGLGGNDVLWGGAGPGNQLYGGLGDDLYVLESNDTIVENAGEGTDTVDARFNSYVLANNVENLVFGGTGDFAGTGNNAANVITGGAGDDVLRGRGGADVLNGGAGNDTADYTLAAAGVVARLDTQRATNDGDGATDTFTSIENLIGSIHDDVLIGDNNANILVGGIGRDTLLGGGGNDILMGGSGGMNNQMQGGAGDDWYILDAFDTCYEVAGEGIDTVEARVGSYTLGANVENLLYTGPGKFVGNGNAMDNVITGGALDDILRGKGGNDTIYGGTGTDEVQLRGVATEYTVSAEGAGYRILDSVAGRDGSTYVESIERLRFSDNATTMLTYGAPGALEPTDKGVVEDFAGPLVSPLVGDPLVQPLADDDYLLLPTDFDGPEVLPALFDDGDLPVGAAAFEGLVWSLAPDPAVISSANGLYLDFAGNPDAAHRPGLHHWE